MDDHTSRLNVRPRAWSRSTCSSPRGRSGAVISAQASSNEMRSRILSPHSPVPKGQMG